MSSISQIPEAYWQNEKDLKKYYAGLSAGTTPLSRGYIVTTEDNIRRETIMRVMCDFSLDYAAMSERLRVHFPSYFEREIASLAEFERYGLVARTSEGMEVTETGRLFIRNIAMSFDNTLAPAGERKHSRTIPVILLTAYPAFKLDPKSVSPHAYVTKTSDMTGLKQQIEKCLNAPDPPYKNPIITAKESRAAAVKPAVQLSMRFDE